MYLTNSSTSSGKFNPCFNPSSNGGISNSTSSASVQSPPNEDDGSLSCSEGQVLDEQSELCVSKDSKTAEDQSDEFQSESTPEEQEQGSSEDGSGDSSEDNNNNDEQEQGSSEDGSGDSSEDNN